MADNIHTQAAGAHAATAKEMSQPKPPGHGHEGVVAINIKHGGTPETHVGTTGTKKSPAGVAFANHHPDMNATPTQKHAFHSDMLMHHAAMATKSNGKQLQAHHEQIESHMGGLKSHAGSVGLSSSFINGGFTEPMSSDTTMAYGHGRQAFAAGEEAKTPDEHKKAADLHRQAKKSHESAAKTYPKGSGEAHLHDVHATSHGMHALIHDDFASGKIKLSQTDVVSLSSAIFKRGDEHKSDGVDRSKMGYKDEHGESGAGAHATDSRKSGRFTNVKRTYADGHKKNLTMWNDTGHVEVHDSHGGGGKVAMAQDSPPAESMADELAGMAMRDWSGTRP